MLTPSGSRVCAEAGVPAANAAAVANPSDSADLLSIFVIAVPFGCFGPLGQSLGPWFANYTGYSGEAQPKICMRGLVQNLARVPGEKCPQGVKSVVSGMSAIGPLCLRKRTLPYRAPVRCGSRTVTRAGGRACVYASTATAHPVRVTDMTLVTSVSVSARYARA